MAVGHLLTCSCVNCEAKLSTVNDSRVRRRVRRLGPGCWAVTASIVRHTKIWKSFRSISRSNVVHSCMNAFLAPFMMHPCVVFDSRATRTDVTTSHKSFESTEFVRSESTIPMVYNKIVTRSIHNTNEMEIWYTWAPMIPHFF
jgi:hypothetical protein